MVAGIIELIVALLALVSGAFLLIRGLRAFHKNKEAKALSKKECLTLGGALLDIALAGFMSQLGLIAVNGWEVSAGHKALMFLGAPLFLVCFAVLWSCFYLHFWRTDMEAKQAKLVHIFLYAAVFGSLLFFYMAGQGAGSYLTYPLVCGFSINGTGWHWLTAANVNDSAVRGGLSIRWYGVIIVFGALCCYWISDHTFYKKYHKHGILETCLLFAFPGGILGARIWYCVGNWHEFASDWTRVFAITDGGLTILGGAVGGMIAGIAYMLIARKWVDIRFAMDAIVPTILIGQAIGRWGNFFNNEVYGQAVALSNGWSWLPTWIANQMHYDGATHAFLAEGMINTPLFLAESLINLAGFFLIYYAVPAIWKKQRGLGVLSGLYLMWYGIVRIIMEPLRNPNYNMGTDGMWSVWNSLVYIILGVALAAFFEVIWILQKGKSWARGSADPVPAEGPKPRKKEKKADVSSAPTMVIGEEKEKPNDDGRA